MKKTLLWLYCNIDPLNYWEGISRTGAEVVAIRLRTSNAALEELAKKFSKNVDKSQYKEIEVNNLEEMITASVELAKTKKIDGIMTVNERLLEITANVAANLGLPYNSVESIQHSQNKYLQRLAFERNNVPVPKFSLIKNESDLKEVVGSFNFPVILKPAVGAGSYQVEEFTDMKSITNYFHNVKKKYINSWNSESEINYLLEEKLIGVRKYSEKYDSFISVESIISEGEIYHLTVTDKLPLWPPFREIGSTMPSILPDTIKNEAYEVASKAIKSLKLTTGATHIEMMITESGIKIIELNARAGGAMPLMLQHCANYNMTEQIARTSLGMPVVSNVSFQKVSKTINFHASSKNVPVRILEIDGFDEAGKIEGVDLCYPVKRVGDILNPNNGKRDCYGIAYLSANNFEDLEKYEQEIYQKINFKFEYI